MPVEVAQQHQKVNIGLRFNMLVGLFPTELKSVMD